MIALIDSGNSRIHCGWWRDNAVIGATAFSNPETDGGFTELLGAFLGDREVTRIAVCSVVSRWRGLLLSTLDTLRPGTVAVARTAAEIGLTVSYERPETYGIDRAMAACAAFELFRDSCIVIDAGTAVTVDAVDAEGRVVGGYIFPGTTLLKRSLTVSTDLPPVGEEFTGEGIGTDTRSCVAFAATMGLAGAIARLAGYAGDRVGNEGRIVMTGGAGDELAGLLPFPVTVRPDLVLEGLGIVHDRLPKYA